MDEEETKGYVYLLDLNNDNLYKLGRTKNPSQRFKAYGLGIDILGCFQCTDYVTTERFLRYSYQNCLVKGREWFKFTGHEVNEILEYLETGEIFNPPEIKLKKRAVPIELPVKMWSKFLHWCVDQGHSSLTAGIKGLIRNACK